MVLLVQPGYTPDNDCNMNLGNNLNHKDFVSNNKYRNPWLNPELNELENFNDLPITYKVGKSTVLLPYISCEDLQRNEFKEYFKKQKESSRCIQYQKDFEMVSKGRAKTAEEPILRSEDLKVITSGNPQDDFIRMNTTTPEVHISVELEFLEQDNHVVWDVNWGKTPQSYFGKHRLWKYGRLMDQSLNKRPPEYSMNRKDGGQMLAFCDDVVIIPSKNTGKPFSKAWSLITTCMKLIFNSEVPSTEAYPLQRTGKLFSKAWSLITTCMILLIVSSQFPSTEAYPPQRTGMAKTPNANVSLIKRSIQCNDDLAVKPIGMIQIGMDVKLTCMKKENIKNMRWEGGPYCSGKPLTHNDMVTEGNEDKYKVLSLNTEYILVITNTSLESIKYFYTCHMGFKCQKTKVLSKYGYEDPSMFTTSEPKTENSKKNDDLYFLIPAIIVIIILVVAGITFIYSYKKKYLCFKEN